MNLDVLEVGPEPNGNKCRRGDKERNGRGQESLRCQLTGLDDLGYGKEHHLLGRHVLGIRGGHIARLDEVLKPSVSPQSACPTMKEAGERCFIAGKGVDGIGERERTRGSHKLDGLQYRLRAEPCSSYLPHFPFGQRGVFKKLDSPGHTQLRN